MCLSARLRIYVMLYRTVSPHVMMHDELVQYMLLARLALHADNPGHLGLGLGSFR